MILQNFIYILLRWLSKANEFDEYSFAVRNCLNAHLVSGMPTQLMIIFFANDIFTAYREIGFITVDIPV